MKPVKLFNNTPVDKRFTASRPTHIRPDIEREYTEDGQRFYALKDGRTFNADMFDKNFKVVQVSKTIKRKGYKGENACKKLAAVA